MSDPLSNGVPDSPSHRSAEPPVIAVVPSPLTAIAAAAVEAMAAAATEHDGTDPLNEHTLLHLHGKHDGDQHLLARDGGGRLVGYAFTDASGSAELVVAPAHRRRGVGTALVHWLAAITDVDRLRVWAHGRIAGVDAFAERLGFEPVRELFRLTRDAETAPPLPEPVLPPGITIRTFEPGRDEDAWLAVNARAFADHPEQGTWGRADLAERLVQPWFDPGGFFLAEDTERGRLAGFHWTKVHDTDPPIGEVYVVGVDPEYRGSRLGKALTVIGLKHLHGGGLRTVELYVDGSNTSARGLYAGLGFREAAVDVQYAARTSTNP